MGHKSEDKYKERKYETGQREDYSEGSDDASMMSILKQVQRQMTYLERKVDNLTNLLEQKSGRDSYPSKSYGEERPARHESRERPFSHSRSRDDDDRSGGHHGDREYSSEKPFKKTFAKSFGKPFGKPSAKPFGKKDGDEKKKFTFKKTASKDKKKFSK